MSGATSSRGLPPPRQGEMIKDFPLEQRLDIIAGMMLLDYSYLRRSSCEKAIIELEKI